MTDSKVIQFCANSAFKSNLYLLSNLADTPFTLTWPRDVAGIPEFLWGEECQYASAEHAFQVCSKAADSQSAKALANLGIDGFKTWPKFVGRGNEKHVEV